MILKGVYSDTLGNMDMSNPGFQAEIFDTMFCNEDSSGGNRAENRVSGMPERLQHNRCNTDVAAL